MRKERLEAGKHARGDKELENMMKNTKGENINRKWRRENVSETKVFV